MTSRVSGRREVLRWGGIMLAGLVLAVPWGCQRDVASPPQAKPAGGVVSAPEASRPPTIALSLDRFQDEARGQSRRGQGHHHLPLINVVRGYVVAPSGEVILLGDRDERQPLAVAVDDLSLVLRHSYNVAQVQRQGPLGMTIDPSDGQSDPWAIQTVGTFGFGLEPGATRGPAMAARFIAIDTRLKFYAAGIQRIGQVPDVFELMRAGQPFCGREADRARATEVRDRYWFTPDLPVDGPRFLEDDGIVLIARPTGVKVEARQQFVDAQGRHSEAAAASPIAGTFAKRFTAEVMARGGATPEAAQIVLDFRLIEFARVMKFRSVPPTRLDHLLAQHEVGLVPIPAYVGGVYRDEHSRVTCAAHVTEVNEGRRRGVSVRQEQQSQQLGSRGGVEAGVPVQPQDFAPDRTGGLATLRSCVLASRPSPTTVSWSIGCVKPTE